MQLPILVVLIILLFFFIEAQIVWAAFIVGLLILMDVFGGLFALLFKFISSIFSGIGSTLHAETEELDNAKPKAPSRKEVVDEPLKKFGKSFGKAEKARKQGKKIVDDRGAFEKIGDASTGLLEGFGKALKK